MAAFLYRAVDPTGRQHRGVIEASSPSGARQILRERNLLPVLVEATARPSRQSERAGASRASFLERLRPAVTARGLTLITRQLATLIGNGIRIEDALRTVAQQSSSPRAASMLLNVRAAILDGRTFASALGDYPQVFSEFYRASIAAGEQSGRLGSVLEHLAAFVEHRQRNRQTVQLAMLYPALLALVSLGIIMALLTFVVPDIVRVFTSRGADLPLLTRGLIAVSNALNSYGWIAALVLVALIAGFRQWLTDARHRRSLHRLIATNALTAGFSRRINAAQFAGTLATLVQSGVPLLEALSAAGEVTPNLYIRTKVADVAGRVREGASLQNAISEAQVFPPMLIAMIASGESSGRLGPTLARAAADQQREVDALVATLVSLVEPAILLLMGGLVMIMVLSILLPIVGLNQLVGV